MARNTVFLLLTCLISVFIGVSSATCKDGVDNVISVHNVINQKDAAVNFNDVKIHAYDQAGKPLCKSGIKFPGFLRVAEGEIEIKRALSAQDDLKIEFDLKHNSFMIGQVCSQGQSKNSFVPDEVCKFEVCKAAPDFCKILANPVTLTRDELPAEYRGLIPLSPFGLSAIQGEWKASAKITRKGKTVAHIQIGPKDGWTHIEIGDDHDAKVFEKTKDSVDKHDDKKDKEEL